MEHTPPNLDPFLSIWTQPRKTIQHIVDSKPEHHVLLLASLYGFALILDIPLTDPDIEAFSVQLLFLLAVVIGPLIGIIGVYFSGWLLSFTGRWLKGTAPVAHIRAAVAWSSVPTISILLLVIPLLLILGEQAYAASALNNPANPFLALLPLGYFLLKIILAIWSAVIFCKALGQVQGFSAWKALGNSVLATAVVFIPLIILIILIVAIQQA